jgi:MFS family permease
MYLAVAASSLLFFLADPVELEMSRMAALMIGISLLLMGLGLLVASLLPLVLSPRPWLWTYALFVICLGMTSACFLPACIPLLIFWLKPETKSYFGKT